MNINNTGSVELHADKGNSVANTFLSISLDGSEMLRATSEGKLGLGTSVPSATFDVRTPQLGQIAGDTDKIFQFGSYSGTNSNFDRLEFKKVRESDGDSWYSASLQLARVVDASTMGYIKFGTWNNDLITFGEGDTERMRLDGSGYLGIGKSNPETNFHSASSNVTVGIFERSSAGNVSVEYRNTMVRCGPV